MGDGNYEVATISGLTRADGWSPIRRHFDVQAFGINAWTARDAGGTVIPEHDERPSGHEELYLVVSGRATFRVHDEEVDAPPGTIVFVRDPETRRGAVAVEPDTTVLAVGGRPREPYRPRAWETNADALALFEDERYAEAKELLLGALDRYEDHGSLLYNIACAEAQLGEVDQSLDHLAAALQERPDLSESAREDDDLAPLRDAARFEEIVG
jgi:tetratricopeptide (TPR) repeat protein